MATADVWTANGQTMAAVVPTSAAINKLALNLLSQLVSTCATPANVFFSPISVATVLAIVSQGAKGNTKSQLLSAFSANQEIDSVWQFLQEICNSFSSNAKKSHLYRLVIANRLLINQDQQNHVNSQFKDCVENKYSTTVEEVDFKKGSELLASINSWVDNQTNGLIKSLFAKPPDPSTKLLLLNTIYFKGTWRLPFNPADTSKYKFKNKGDPNNLSDVDFMLAQDVHMKYITTTLNQESVQIIEVPYKSNMSMFVILTDRNDGLFSLTHDKNRPLSYLELSQKLSEMKPVLLDLLLPKFKLESQYLMNDALRSLGIEDAFNVQTADFTGIRDKSGLFVSDFFHKAVIDVTEEGTEAAAATCMDVVEGMFDRSACPKFVADHPFLFLIRDNKRNLILFVGEMVQFD